MNRVLLVAPDRVGPEMAGPGIRYVELARALAASCDVTIAAPPGSQALESGPEVVTYAADGPYALRRLVRPGDVVIAPPLAPHVVLGLGSARRPWIVDLYNPEPFEGLEHQKARSRAERKARDILRIDRIVRGASPASRTRSRRSSTLGSGAGSTSGPRTSKAPASAGRSRSGATSTTSGPRTTSSTTTEGDERGRPRLARPPSL